MFDEFFMFILIKIPYTFFYLVHRGIAQQQLTAVANYFHKAKQL